MEAHYGGTLVPGDFVCIARHGYLELGWFAKEGKGTLHFYCFRSLQLRMKDNHTLHKNSIAKPYVGVKWFNTIRISDPFSVLSSHEDRVAYVKGTQILKDLKLI
jgi:hypothetical protein